MNPRQAEAIHALGKLGITWSQILAWINQFAQSHGLTFLNLLSYLETLLPYILQMLAKGTPATQVEQWVVAAILALLGGKPLPPVP